MKPRSQLLRSSQIKLIHTSCSFQTRRQVHLSRKSHASATATASPNVPISSVLPQSKQTPSLACLPTSTILRSYIITRMSSSPILLGACFKVLRNMLESKSFLLDPERNLLLRWLFKRTFYAQFCAGENKAEVQQSVAQVKSIGYTGVILEYALEVLGAEASSAESTAQEVERWRKGMLETVDIASKGDFVGLKWSGLGYEALRLLKADQPPTPEMEAAIHEACDAAAAKGVLLLPGAEEEITNTGINSWTLDLMKKYNKEKAIMFNTYQCILLSTPVNLVRHLGVAQQEGFIPGIKVVRGAYLAMEPKDRVCKSKQETDKMYDALVEALLRRRYNSVLKSVDSSPFPPVSLMIASHNLASVQKARAIRFEQAQKGEERIECAYAQLQGMADEISCELVQASKHTSAEGEARIDRPRAFKCATWGTLNECMNFLLRRASENQDAAGRTADTRIAMGKELRRRWTAGVGLG